MKKMTWKVRPSSILLILPRSSLRSPSWSLTSPSSSSLILRSKFLFPFVIIKVWNSRRLWKCIDWHAATVARGDTGDKGKRRWEVAFAFPPTRGNHDSTNESHRIGMSSIRGNRRITDELCGFFGHKSTGTMQRKRVVIYFTRVTVFLYGTVDNHAFAICNSRES